MIHEPELNEELIERGNVYEMEAGMGERTVIPNDDSPFDNQPQHCRIGKY